MSTFAELRAKVRGVLQDADGNYWTDDELDLYLNEAQDEFCRHTRVLRGEHPLTTRENQAVYTLPEDCLEVLRVIGKEGTEVQAAHSRALHGLDLSSTGTGDPLYHYSDLDGDGKMRFYPQPKPTIETGPTTFAATAGYLVDPKLGIGTVKSISALDTMLYVADETNLYEYEIDGESLILRDSIAHGITVSQQLFLNPVPAGQDESDWPTLTYAVAGDVWVLHDTSIYYWDRSAGSMVTFSAAGLTSRVNGVARFMTGTATTIGWSSIDGDLYSSFNLGLDTFSETTGVPAAGAIEWSDSDYNTARGYMYDSGDTRKEYHRLEFNGTWGSQQYVGIPGIDSIDDDPRIAAAANFAEINTSTITDELWTLDGNSNLWVVNSSNVNLAQSADNADFGAIVYFNGSTFNQETGAVIDLTSDDLVTFDSEVGIVTSFITAEKIANIYYVRKPRKGEVEISDTLALVWYAIARAYEQDGEQSHLRRSAYYADKFRRIMGRTRRRIAAGFNSNSTPRQIRTF